MSDLSQLTTSLAQIVAAGGPKIDRCYDFTHKTVEGGAMYTDPQEHDGLAYAKCPKACEDGVIAYAMELCDEYDNEWNTCDIRNMSSRFSVCVYRSDLLDKPLFLSHCTTRLAASIALIKAVAERVGVEDE